MFYVSILIHSVRQDQRGEVQVPEIEPHMTGSPHTQQAHQDNVGMI